jgi:RNA polymerase sigma-70 factor, ECF subfamily
LNEPDPAVVQAAQHGDAAAFEELVRSYQAEVWRLCLHLLRSESLADDATQDCFVRAYRFISTYKGRSRFTTWLLSIARNCAVDEMRRAGRRKRTEEALRAERPAVSTEPPPRLEVREALALLPLDLREAVVLIDVLGLSYADASGVLNTPVGTVKSRVHRARVTLSHELLERPSDDSEASR